MTFNTSDTKRVLKTDMDADMEILYDGYQYFISTPQDRKGTCFVFRLPDTLENLSRAKEGEVVCLGTGKFFDAARWLVDHVEGSEGAGVGADDDDEDEAEAKPAVKTKAVKKSSVRRRTPKVTNRGRGKKAS